MQDGHAKTRLCMQMKAQAQAQAQAQTKAEDRASVCMMPYRQNPCRRWILRCSKVIMLYHIHIGKKKNLRGADGTEKTLSRSGQVSFSPKGVCGVRGSFCGFEIRN